MGFNAQAFVVYGFEIDADCSGAGMSADWQQRRYESLWQSLGLDASHYVEPSGDAGYGSEEEHFICQVAEATRLRAVQTMHRQCPDYVVGVVLEQAVNGVASVNLSKAEASLTANAATMVARVAEVFGVADVSTHLVPFYG